MYINDINPWQPYKVVSAFCRWGKWDTEWFREFLPIYISGIHVKDVRNEVGYKSSIYHNYNQIVGWLRKWNVRIVSFTLQAVFRNLLCVKCKNGSEYTKIHKLGVPPSRYIGVMISYYIISGQ